MAGLEPREPRLVKAELFLQVRAQQEPVDCPALVSFEGALAIGQCLLRLAGVRQDLGAHRQRGGFLALGGGSGDGALERGERSLVFAADLVDAAGVFVGGDEFWCEADRFLEVGEGFVDFSNGPVLRSAPVVEFRGSELTFCFDLLSELADHLLRGCGAPGWCSAARRG